MRVIVLSPYSPDLAPGSYFVFQTKKSALGNAPKQITAEQTSHKYIKGCTKVGKYFLSFGLRAQFKRTCPGQTFSSLRNYRMFGSVRALLVLGCLNFLENYAEAS